MCACLHGASGVSGTEPPWVVALRAVAYWEKTASRRNCSPFYIPFDGVLAYSALDLMRATSIILAARLSSGNFVSTVKMPVRSAESHSSSLSCLSWLIIEMEKVHTGSAFYIPVFYTGSQTFHSSNSFKTKNKWKRRHSNRQKLISSGTVAPQLLPRWGSLDRLSQLDKGIQYHWRYSITQYKLLTNVPCLYSWTLGQKTPAACLTAPQEFHGAAHKWAQPAGDTSQGGARDPDRGVPSVRNWAALQRTEQLAQPRSFETNHRCSTCLNVRGDRKWPPKNHNSLS